MIEDVTGIILSGGKSQRMGRDKALIKFGDVTAIEIITKLMKSIFKDVFIVTDNRLKYEFLKLPTYEDIYKGIGPLAGIHAGLLNSKTYRNYFISCDMVLMNKEIIEYQLKLKTEKPIVVYKVEGYLQPFSGIYTKECISYIEAIINNASKKFSNSPLELITMLDSEIIDIDKTLLNYKDGFLNMNSQDDYIRVFEILNTHQNT